MIVVLLLAVHGKLWVVAEDSVEGLELPAGAKISIVDKFFGFKELAKDVQKGTFPIEAMDVLYLLIGRAEVMSRERNLLDEVQILLHTVNIKKKEVKVVLAGPFPRGLDDARRVRKIHSCGLKMRKLADMKTVFFSFVADQFTTPMGVNRELMDERRLTERGRQTLKSQIVSFVERNALMTVFPNLKVTVNYEDQ